MASSAVVLLDSLSDDSLCGRVGDLLVELLSSSSLSVYSSMSSFILSMRAALAAGGRLLKNTIVWT